jgi:hypothetical protein
MPDDQALEFTLDGKSYPIDDFTLGEIEWLEDELGGSLDSVDLSSIKVVSRFITVIKRRDNPAFTLDDARALKLSVLNNEEDESSPARPTKASGKRKAAARAG